MPTQTNETEDKIEPSGTGDNCIEGAPVESPATASKKTSPQKQSLIPPPKSWVPNKGGVTEPIPVKIRCILDDADTNGHSHIISWITNEDFKVHDKEKLMDNILPKYGICIKWTSFVRNLTLWGFKRISPKLLTKANTNIPHEYRGLCRDADPSDAYNLVRTAVKGKGKRTKSAALDTLTVASDAAVDFGNDNVSILDESFDDEQARKKRSKRSNKYDTLARLVKTGPSYKDRIVSALSNTSMKREELMEAVNKSFPTETPRGNLPFIRGDFATALRMVLDEQDVVNEFEGVFSLVEIEVPNPDEEEEMLADLEEKKKKKKGVKKTTRKTKKTTKKPKKVRVEKKGTKGRKGKKADDEEKKETTFPPLPPLPPLPSGTTDVKNHVDYVGEKCSNEYAEYEV